MRRSLLLVALSLGIGCDSTQLDLQCAKEICATVPLAAPMPETPVTAPTRPSPLPEPPVIVSSGCQQPRTVTWQPSDLANSLSFERPCLTELVDENGCVGDRVEHQFDGQGLVVRTERWVFDPDVLTPTYVVPTSAITIYGYDAEGRRTVRTRDELSDGTIELTEGWN